MQSTSLPTKPLGRTGVEIPEIGIGTWDYRGGPELLRRGVELGAVLVDTAESYGTEEAVGQAVAGIRDRVFIATKVSSHNLRPEDLRRSAAASLRRLGLDHIDLYQIHQPNPDIPIEDTVGAMEQLVDEGKIRFIGVSNFDLEQLEAACRAARKHPIVSNQVRYNLADRTIEGGLLRHCQDRGITVIAYSPLAREISRLFDSDPKGVLTQIARETGHTPAQIAINWCLAKDGVVAIPKANSWEHLAENCVAAGWRLSDQHLRLLDQDIVSRRRGPFDRLIRSLVPPALAPLAKRCLKLLPQRLRRRVS